MAYDKTVSCQKFCYQCETRLELGEDVYCGPAQKKSWTTGPSRATTNSCAARKPACASGWATGPRLVWWCGSVSWLPGYLSAGTCTNMTMQDETRP